MFDLDKLFYGENTNVIELYARFHCLSKIVDILYNKLNIKISEVELVEIKEYAESKTKEKFPNLNNDDVVGLCNLLMKLGIN